MLMVVLGAGASYDSIPALWRKPVYESRPPLANELFEPREMFSNTMLQVGRSILPIVPLLQNLPVGRTVEQVLEEPILRGNRWAGRGRLEGQNTRSVRGNARFGPMGVFLTVAEARLTG